MAASGAATLPHPSFRLRGSRSGAARTSLRAGAQMFGGPVAREHVSYVRDSLFKVRRQHQTRVFSYFCFLVQSTTSLPPTMSPHCRKQCEAPPSAQQSLNKEMRRTGGQRRRDTKAGKTAFRNEIPSLGSMIHPAKILSSPAAKSLHYLWVYAGGDSSPLVW